MSFDGVIFLTCAGRLSLSVREQFYRVEDEERTVSFERAFGASLLNDSHPPACDGVVWLENNMKWNALACKCVTGNLRRRVGVVAAFASFGNRLAHTFTCEVGAWRGGG